MEGAPKADRRLAPASLGGPPRRLLLAAAACAALIALVLFSPATWRVLHRALEPPPAAAPEVAPSPAAEAPAPAPPSAPQASPPVAARPVAEPREPEEEEPVLVDDVEVVEPNDAPALEPVESPYGVPGGIAAFPPMGTQPLLKGIIVPDDYEVPEGFVKHYQVTDDGETMLPILMFHPDYELLDADGNAIPLPSNRVVPQELAPEGLPIEFLELPEPRE